MAYINTSMKKAIALIESGRMYLPAIQRKYVWREEQITKLFDSLMQGYPIGTFLFWKVSKKQADNSKSVFYKFIKDYNEKNNTTNEKITCPLVLDYEYYYIVLDGQQRLTSMYVALQGSIAMKKPRCRWSSSNAFPKKELYFNINSDPLNKCEDDDFTYEFKFFEENEVEKDKQWFKVKDILIYEDNAKLMEYFVLNSITNSLQIKNLSRLLSVVCDEEKTPVVSYYEIDKDIDQKERTYDDVLNIFVRVNSGGTVLSKSDLLFSTIVSTWKEARDKVENIIQEVNGYGNKFNFNNDFIMRTCLYVNELPINLQLESFKSDNIMQIKDNWKKTEDSIKGVVNLLVEFGFCNDNIISYNAIIPMIYYVFIGGKIDNDNVVKELHKYFIISQTKNLFGVASNSALSSTRSALNKYKSKYTPFNMEMLKDIKLTGNRNFLTDENYIDDLLENYVYGSPYTFMILSLLYDNIKLGQYEWHVDHMHPFSSFYDNKLKKLALDNETIKIWQYDRNKLGNLQLLEGKENKRKNDESFIDWLKVNEKFAKYLPKVDLQLTNFEEFLNQRQALLKTRLLKIFDISIDNNKNKGEDE